MYIHAYIYIYIYIYIFIYTHAHTNIYIFIYVTFCKQLHNIPVRNIHIVRIFPGMFAPRIT